MECLNQSCLLLLSTELEYFSNFILFDLFLIREDFKMLKKCLSSFFQHQQQVALAVDRAKQITMAELNAVMQVSTSP